MTVPSAVNLLAEVRQLGGHLRPKNGGKLGVVLPEAEQARLLPAIRERKQDLLMLLRPLELPCIACGGMYRWQDTAGAWRCGKCEPDPRVHRLRGVTLETLGDRPIVLQPPTGDLGAPGSWARTPTGETMEVVLYRDDGAEVLMRTLKGDRLAWCRPEELRWEIDWPWGA